jgi:RimJ/RimL family protein N-acetyltransferase
MPLSTSRLLLREFTRDDLNDLHEVLGNPIVMKFSLNGPYSPEKTAAFIEGCLEAYPKRKAGLLAVVSRVDAKVIGCCGFYFLQIDGADEIEISYRLNPLYWNRGLATEAALALKNQAFGEFGFTRLIACIEEGNASSIRVAEKIGMCHEKDTLYRERIPARIYSVENR